MVRKQELLVIILITAMLLIFTGCGLNQQIKPFADWTPTEKATWFMKMYNSEYASYQIQAELATLTEEQKAILRTKKQALIEVYPLIQTYSKYVKDGKLPSADIELQINRYLDQITEAIIGGIK